MPRYRSYSEQVPWPLTLTELRRFLRVVSGVGFGRFSTFDTCDYLKSDPTSRLGSSGYTELTVREPM